MPEDLPSEFGFIYFEKPITGLFDEDGDSPIVAASWGIMSSPPPQFPYGAVWVTWYVDRDLLLASLSPNQLAEQSHGWRLRSRMVLEDETQILFTPEVRPLHHGSGPMPPLFKAAAILRATWLLMGQTLTRNEPAQYTRADRRRIEKQGQTPPEVRVISLRRSETHGGEGTGSRDYHHQWIVRGHWRMQPWGPNRERRRPVWIAPHIKGPEGAPLLGGEKVYALHQ